MLLPSCSLRCPRERSAQANPRLLRRGTPPRLVSPPPYRSTRTIPAQTNGDRKRVVARAIRGLPASDGARDGLPGQVKGGMSYGADMDVRLLVVVAPSLDHDG